MNVIFIFEARADKQIDSSEPETQAINKSVRWII